MKNLLNNKDKKLSLVKKNKILTKKKENFNSKKISIYNISFWLKIWSIINPFFKCDSKWLKKISSLNDKEYEKLKLSTKSFYIKHYYKYIENKRKILIKNYSSKNLNKKFFISFVNPSKRISKKEIDAKNNIINVSNLQKDYYNYTNRTTVLKDINFCVKKGDFLVILGPSGSGKSTLLNLISGLDVSTNGDVFVDGINLSVLSDKHMTFFRKYHVGFIFQQYHLLPNLTAKYNIDLGANLAKIKNTKYINKIVKLLDLQDHINKYPYQLSGGQQQRVSIARALAKRPLILICDEPTGALDFNTSKIVLKILCDINKILKTTIILVTHNHSIVPVAKTKMEISDGKIISYKKIENRVSPNKL